MPGEQGSGPASLASVISTWMAIRVSDYSGSFPVRESTWWQKALFKSARPRAAASRPPYFGHALCACIGLDTSAVSTFGAYSGADLFDTSAASSLDVSSDPVTCFAPKYRCPIWRPPVLLDEHLKDYQAIFFTTFALPGI